MLKSPFPLFLAELFVSELNPFMAMKKVIAVCIIERLGMVS
jgi:hypothetical protein